MRNDENEIRALIERWAKAVHSGDMNTVLADHAQDIVMFDVPPPHRGVRGIEDYRKTWPPFFEWQAQGALFEIESLEVTAGEDVAFAFALLRCGTPQEFERNPHNRLRLTLGLRKEQDKWIVAHEHHSFPDVSNEQTSEAEDDVRGIHQRWFESTRARDLDGLMTHIDPNIVSYEHDAPLQYTGVASVREVCRRALEASSGSIEWTVPDLTVMVREDIAVAWGLNRMKADTSDGEAFESWSRGTRVFQRKEGGWQMIHQHVSYPYDPATGEAKVDLKPG